MDWPTFSPQFVTALPSTPLDGQEIYYQADSTNAINWHLRFNQGSSSAYKWEFVGGSELYGRRDSAFTSATGATVLTYADIDTTNLQLTAPLAGDYDIEWGGDCNGTPANTFSVYVAPKIGSNAAADTDAMIMTFSTSAGVSGRGAPPGSRMIRVASLTASTVIKLQFRADASLSSAISLDQSWLSLRPVRAG